MKKILGILAIALLVVFAGASCKTKAHCDAYSSMSDTNKNIGTNNR
ncbi:hypothetical protein [Fluviicola sp.]|nr:hypothetical protein [Fluviicola sp.]